MSQDRVENENGRCPKHLKGVAPQLLVANALLLSALNETLALNLELRGGASEEIAEFRELAEKIREQVRRINEKGSMDTEDSKAAAALLTRLIAMNAQVGFSEN